MASPDLAPVPDSAPHDWRHPPGETRRRALAIALTVVIHLLLALLLLNLAPASIRKPFSRTLSTFIVMPEGGGAEGASVRRDQQRERRRATRPIPQRPTPPRPTPPVPEVPLPEYLRMSRDQFTATDLARLPRSLPRETDPKPDDVTEATPADSSAGGLAIGPGGALVYPGAWERLPTLAETIPYIPFPERGGWGEIICRTIPGNRVENCQVYRESPVGSKIATGMRRAAWQFRIRPRRINGKPLIGELVLIHYDLIVEDRDSGR